MLLDKYNMWLAETELTHFSLIEDKEKLEFLKSHGIFFQWGNFQICLIMVHFLGFEKHESLFRVLLVLHYLRKK